MQAAVPSLASSVSVLEIRGTLGYSLNVSLMHCSKYLSLLISLKVGVLSSLPKTSFSSCTTSSCMSGCLASSKRLNAKAAATESWPCVQEEFDDDGDYDAVAAAHDDDDDGDVDDDDDDDDNNNNNNNNHHHPILVSVHAESMVLFTTANSHNNNNSDSSSNNITLLTMATTHAWTKAKIRTASINVLSSCTTSSSLKDLSVSEAASSRSTNDLFFWVPETAHFTLDESAIGLA